MDELNFLKQVGLTRGQGDGFRKEIDLDIRNAYLLSDGSALTTTLTTNPGFAAAETNAMVIQWAATKVIGAAFDFPVPRDYDQAVDELRVRAFVQMAGATDTPTLSLSVYRKRLATALTADQGPFTGKAASPGLSPLTAAQAPTLNLSNALQVVEFDVSKKVLQGGDVLYFNLVPGAHGTDAINLYGGVVMYRTTVALYNESQR